MDKARLEELISSRAPKTKAEAALLAFIDVETATLMIQTVAKKFLSTIGTALKKAVNEFEAKGWPSEDEIMALFNEAYDNATTEAAGQSEGVEECGHRRCTTCRLCNPFGTDGNGPQTL